MDSWITISPGRRWFNAKANRSWGIVMWVSNTGHLTKGMDAGIRPAGPCEHDLFTYQVLDGRLEDRLDADAVGLHLPAAVVCPVISND